MNPDDFITAEWPEDLSLEEESFWKQAAQA
jgi:hypothetical protein